MEQSSLKKSNINGRRTVSAIAVSAGYSEGVFSLFFLIKYLK